MSVLKTKSPNFNYNGWEIYRIKRFLILVAMMETLLAINWQKMLKKYIAIDLSISAIERLRRNLNKKGCKNYIALAIDILSDDFTEKNFDIIYAQGVIHHFKHIEVVLKRMHDLLNPKGLVITRDPLKSAFASKAVRYFYHQFRTDKDWEWPLTKNAFGTIKKYFKIKNVQGIMGASILGIPVSFINNNLAIKITKKLHAIDMKKATTISKDLWRCMQAIMCLEKV